MTQMIPVSVEKVQKKNSKYLFTSLHLQQHTLSHFFEQCMLPDVNMLKIRIWAMLLHIFQLFHLRKKNSAVFEMIFDNFTEKLFLWNYCNGSFVLCDVACCEVRKIGQTILNNYQKYFLKSLSNIFSEIIQFIPFHHKDKRIIFLLLRWYS